MSLITSIVPCEDVQIELNTVFQKRRFSTFLETPAFLNFLQSPLNTDGVLKENVAPGGGKLRTVNVRYEQRLTPDLINSNFDIVCNPTQQQGDTITTYSLDPDTDGNSYSFTIPLSTLRDNCMENGDWLFLQLLRAMNGMSQTIAQKMADQSLNAIGVFVDEADVINDVKTVTTVDGSGNNVQDLIEEVTYNSENNGFVGGTWVFGWTELKKYFMRVAAGCCLQTGIDISTFGMQNPLVFAGDFRVELAMGLNNFLATSPGALQVLDYVEFEGQTNMSNDDSHEQRTIVDPQTGLRYDLLMQKVCANNGISIHVSLRNATQLVSYPTDLFDPKDRMSGSTMVNQYEIINP